MDMPNIAKSNKADNPSNTEEVKELTSSGSAVPNPWTRKFTPRVIKSHCPICSTLLDDRFILGVVKTSLIGRRPNNCNNLLLNMPEKITRLPKINQNGNMDDCLSAAYYHIPLRW
jgi:hypothetical protein